MRTRGEVWREAHAHRMECPDCGKFLTLRTLRWKHVCGERTMPRRMLDERSAKERFELLAEVAVHAHAWRMRDIENGATGCKRGADQGAVGGA